jgi:8-oxo-dGTP diphosphatase
MGRNMIPTVGVLIFHNQNVLLVRHGQGAGHLNNTYGLPAGRIDEGESSVEAALRELQEETGLVASAEDVVLMPQEWNAVIERKDGPRHFSLRVYFCRKFSGEIVASSEGVPEWIDIQKINEYALLPNVKEIIHEGLLLV